MRLLVTAPDWVAALLLLLLVLAALQDGWRLRISDWISGLVAILAFVALVLDGPVSGLWQNFLLFAGVLAVGTFMFGRGWMGGGDIKLLAACALWFDLSQGWKMLVVVAIVGGLETLIVMLLRALPWPIRLRNRLAVLRRNNAIPYGVAIGLGVALIGFSVR